MLAAQIFEVLLQQRPHRDDPVRHPLDLPQPLPVQPAVVEDRRRDTCTVHWRVGVERPDKDLDLRIHSLLLFHGGTDDREGSYTLTIETLDSPSPLADCF